jgi:hypothetical protein
MGFGEYKDEKYNGVIPLIFGPSSIVSKKEFIEAFQEDKLQWFFYSDLIRYRLNTILVP